MGPVGREGPRWDDGQIHHRRAADVDGGHVGKSAGQDGGVAIKGYAHSVRDLVEGRHVENGVVRPHYRARRPAAFRYLCQLFIGQQAFRQLPADERAAAKAGRIIGFEIDARVSEHRQHGRLILAVQRLRRKSALRHHADRVLAGIHGGPEEGLRGFLLDGSWNTRASKCRSRSRYSAGMTVTNFAVAIEASTLELEAKGYVTPSGKRYSASAVASMLE